MKGKYQYRDRLGVCVCVCEGTQALMLTQTKRQPYCRCITGAEVKFSCRQNLSFLNGSGLINIHYRSQQTQNPKGLFYYTAFASKEQTNHRGRDPNVFPVFSPSHAMHKLPLFDRKKLYIWSKQQKKKKPIAAGMTGTNSKSASIEFNVIALKSMFTAWNRKINNKFVAQWKDKCWNLS